MESPADKLTQYFDLLLSSGNIRQLSLLLLDLLLIPLSLYLALAVRLSGESMVELDFGHLVVAVVTTLVTVSIFLSLGLYRAVVRYMGGQAALAVFKGVSASALVLAIGCFLMQTWIPRSLPFIYWLIAIALIGGSRTLIRFYYQKSMRKAGKLAIIYGAGEAGRQLMSAINHGHLYRVALFVDDNPELLNRIVNGILVKHPEKLTELIRQTGARYVFLAIPSLSRERRREIIESLVGLHVHVKTVPTMEEVFEGGALASMQEIEVDDLLPRQPIDPDVTLLADCVAGRSVLVTGAGGSIGSELTRQIVQCEPSKLILVEQSEYSLYQIEGELKAYIKTNNLPVELICLLASVQDCARMEQVFETYTIQTIYHAAAYKHVPMVEHNILEGLKNNVLGTYNLVRLAEQYDVGVFTLISTDKAVRPTNVMGASKRFAELILQAYAMREPNTRFCMVRFGNVLGSSGSVVPMFREQIRSGGPVTVTHPDVIRYFMTIPEAAQLVLQASAMGEGGDVFLLDMGEPIKIVELARRMILLMGREIKDENNPEGDVEIEFSGLRPGEKLYEELLIGDNPIGTEHPKIMRAEEASIAYDELQELLVNLEMACKNGACDIALEILCQAVPEYSQGATKDTIWTKRNDSGINNVIEGDFRDREALH